MPEEIYRNYYEEREYGVSRFRGILVGLMLSVVSWAVIGGVVATIFFVTR